MNKQFRRRFQFLADAYRGAGGFAPRVSWSKVAVEVRKADGSTSTAYRNVASLDGPCLLVPHPRESDERYAARAAMATYENHLREAVERYVGYLTRRAPMRDGTEAPLVQLLLQDADRRGNSLDGFWGMFAAKARARGSMLLLIDHPEEIPRTQRDQIEGRVVPFLSAIEPEAVSDCEIDTATGDLRWVEIDALEVIDGKLAACTRRWDQTHWSVLLGKRVVRSGEHGFGACPVLAFTENGEPFPVIGKYAQIADLSLGIFNNRSRLDEINASQTFSVLTLQVPPETAGLYSAAAAVADIGVHSILTYPGEAPGYISPDQGNAETYLKVISELQTSIRRVAMDEATTEGGAAESGVARKLRFERLNADLASFARRLGQLERRVWTLFHRAIGTANAVTVEWPTDFNLVDTLAELEILALMQTTGFPPEVLSAKREAVVASEWDAADDETKAALIASVQEQAQAQPEPGGVPGTQPGAA